jgi:hypothetical protein
MTMAAGQKSGAETPGADEQGQPPESGDHPRERLEEFLRQRLPQDGTRSPSEHDPEGQDRPGREQDKGTGP